MTASRTETPTHRTPDAGSAPGPAAPRPTVADVLRGLLGDEVPVRIECYDGSALGPPEARSRVVVHADAPRYLVGAPGELGLGRAFVAGAIEVEGDIFDVLALRARVPGVRVRPRALVGAARVVLDAGVWPLPPAPPEEARLRGRRHGKARDAAAIAHHYDVSNAFYRLFLGPTMTYSCAVFAADDTSLDDAQSAKYDLICRKLGLRPGMRLLDVGCGWGGMVMHAARHYGVEAVGITISARQVDWARRAVAEAGFADRVEIRLQDYRDVHDGPYDAISSIGMFEHVGLARLDEYFGRLHELLVPRGRLLNHGIARPGGRSRLARRGFIQRYVFPDGELHEVGAVATHIQRAGFEVRHTESLREHYAKTLRQWVANLERHWDDAVREVGVRRARVWRLYMAASACLFEDAKIQVHQVLAVRDDAAGGSGMALRPDW